MFETSGKMSGSMIKWECNNSKGEMKCTVYLE